MAMNRQIAMAKMTAAVAAGVTATNFIQQMRQQGLAYRDSDMYRDYASVVDRAAKQGALTKLRPEQRPAAATMAEVPWNLSKNYLYTVKVKYYDIKSDTIGLQYVNITSDVRLTISEIQQQTSNRWPTSESGQGKSLIEAVPWSAYHRSE